MHGEIKEVGFGIKSKVFMYLTAVASLVLGVSAVVHFYFNDQLYHILLIAIPLILFSILGFIYASKFRLRLADDYIEKVSFGSKRLFYDQVETVQFYDSEVEVRSKSSKISLTWDVANQEEMISEVLSKIKNNPRLKVLGDEKRKQVYFKSKSR